jgi:hypothetical protein
MANSDKNILITPNIGSSTLNPNIRFTGSDNLPITLRVLDNSGISFEGASGQLFSITDGFTGTIFSVTDISGIPSIEVSDAGLIKISQYLGNVSIGSSTSTAKLTVKTSSSYSTIQDWQNSSGESVASISSSGSLAGTGFDIYPLDDISLYFDGREKRFLPRYQGVQITPLNGFRLLLTVNGIIQSVDTPEYVWQSMLPRYGFFIDSDGFIAFHEQVAQGSTFDARLLPGSSTTKVTKNYPFKAADILLGV